MEECIHFFHSYLKIVTRSMHSQQFWKSLKNLRCEISISHFSSSKNPTTFVLQPIFRNKYGVYYTLVCLQNGILILVQYVFYFVDASIIIITFLRLNLLNCLSLSFALEKLSQSNCYHK